MTRLILLMLIGCIGMTTNAVAHILENISADIQKSGQEERTDSLVHAEALQAMIDKYFVLEADRAVLKDGQTVYVSSGINFVSVENDKAVVQISFNANASGLNGVGGITVEGSVSAYKMEQDKRGYTYLTCNVLGTGISARIDITLSPETNRASVTVTPNFNSNKVTLTGILKSAGNSNVFKGISL